MQLKGTMGFLGALALVLSMIPAASAGIPVPGATVVGVVYDGADTTTNVGDRVVTDVVGLEGDTQVKVDAFARSVGDVIMDGDGSVDSQSLIEIAGIATNGVFDVALGESQVYQGFATQSAGELSLAGEAVTRGSIDAANSGLDAAVDVGFGTQRVVDTTLVNLGASTQSMARSVGGVQGVAVQGGLDTYNAHAAPAACAFAGIVADFTGTVNAEESCGFLL